MVGWSRRSTEAAARRKRWWNSLTPEEQKQIRLAEEKSDRFWMPLLKTIIFICIGMLLTISILHWKCYL